MRISDWSSDVCSSDLPLWRARRWRLPDEARQTGVPPPVADRRFHSDSGHNPLRRSQSGTRPRGRVPDRSEEHTSELQSLMRISYAVFCLKKKKQHHTQTSNADLSIIHNNKHHSTKYINNQQTNTQD